MATAGPKVLDALPGAVYVCDHEGWLVRYNSEAATQWGRAPALGENRERFCGSHRLFLTDGSALPHSACPMAEAVRVGTDTCNAEVVIERPDGSRYTALVNIRAEDAARYARQVRGELDSYVIRKRALKLDGTLRYLDVHSSSVRGPEGRFRYGVRVIQDVTEAQRMEDRIRESEQHMRDLLEALPAAVYTTDAEGRITFFNKAATEMAGGTPLQGQQWCVSWRLYTPDGTPLLRSGC